MLVDIVGPAGRLEALLEEPTAGTDTGLHSVVVLAHPHPEYGGTMHTKAIYHAAKAFVRIGCAVLRFNFRGVGSSAGRFDDGRGERLDFEAALNHAATAFPGTPLWAAGMSFGAWVGLSAGATDSRVSALVGIATPVNLYDLSAIAAAQEPKFFIHGERDEICPIKAMWKFYADAAEPKELVVIDTADHVFDGLASEVGDAVEQLLGDWPA
jgi:alpha/beta superfamily hydrolase